VKVLVIPEDQELDRYVVKPVVEALFDDLGIRARVDVLPEPRLRGASEALNSAVVAEIVADNPVEDLFLLLVDRDCDRQGNAAKAAARQSEHADRMIACLAVQEVEVWMLALHKDDLDVTLGELRKECDPKERFAEPFLRKLGSESPGRGRKAAMRALRGRWNSLCDSCPELRKLSQDIDAWRTLSRR
jgi:hypothetical protein